jgi:hypothetical protein
MNDGSLWGIATIAGPIILLIVLVWVINNNHNKRVSKSETERATDANYQAEDAASKAKDAAD